jgi:hypothetical protein
MDARAAQGTYLTDGSALFRLVWPERTRGARSEMRLENCKTLGVRRYTTRELAEMRLRRVKPRECA